MEAAIAHGKEGGKGADPPKPRVLTVAPHRGTRGTDPLPLTEPLAQHVIVERGNHTELLANHGAYSLLYDAQLAAPIDSDGERQGDLASRRQLVAVRQGFAGAAAVNEHNPVKS